MSSPFNDCSLIETPYWSSLAGKFVPMVRVGGCSLLDNKHQPQCNTPLTPKLLERERQAALKKRSSLKINSSSSVEYPSSKPVKKLEIKSDVYYSPAVPNPTFIVHNHTLYLFQFRVTVKQHIEDFLGFFDKCTIPYLQTRWHFVFVRPLNRRTTMKYPVPATNALQELALYSTEVAAK